MKKTFNIQNLFKEAWSDYKSHWLLFILIGIIFIIVGVLSNMGINQSAIISIAGWALQMFIILGYIKFLLHIVDKKEAKIEQLFQGAQSLKHYISFLVVSLLISSFSGILIVPIMASAFLAMISPLLAWVVGTLFTIILVTVIVGLAFARYLAAEQKAGIFESLKESWKGTRSNQWKILWFMIVMIFFNILGALAFVIGLVITIPMTSLMYVRMYRELFDCECTDGVCVCRNKESEKKNLKIVAKENQNKK
jgi:hypothetical protein